MLFPYIENAIKFTFTKRTNEFKVTNEFKAYKCCTFTK